MRKTVLAVLMLGLALVFLPTVARADGNVNGIYGQRTLGDDSWEPAEDQELYGVVTDFGGKNWPVHLSVGYFNSEDEGSLANFPILGSVDLDAELSEWTVGVNKTWKSGIVRPYIGAGVSFIDADADVTSALGEVSDSDDTTGIYVEGGVYWRLGEVFNLGIHGRIVEGTDVTLFDTDGDADYYQIGALFGFGWK